MIEQIEWISVDDELPEEGITVLVVKDVGRSCEGYREGDLLYATLTNWSMSKAKYWAHMPTGPKQIGGES